MTASRKPPISASRKLQESDNIVTWTEMHVMLHMFRRSETQLHSLSLTPTHSHSLTLFHSFSHSLTLPLSLSLSRVRHTRAVHAPALCRTSDCTCLCVDCSKKLFVLCCVFPPSSLDCSGASVDLRSLVHSADVFSGPGRRGFPQGLASSTRPGSGGACEGRAGRSCSAPFAQPAWRSSACSRGV